MSRFLNQKAIKSYFKNSNKQISSDVIMTLDNAVHSILSKSLSATKNFKRVTSKEVEHVCSSINK